MSEETKSQAVSEEVSGADPVVDTKAEISEFRNKNIELMKEMDALRSQFKGIDVEKYRELQELDRQKRDKELIDSKQFDVLIEERTKHLTSDYDGRLNKLAADLEAANAHALNLQKKYDIETATSHALAEFKINPDFSDAVMAMVKSKFDIDNGKVVAMKDGVVESGADGGNLTIKGFIQTLPDSYKLQSQGSTARGGDKMNIATQSALTGRDKIAAGLAARAKM